MKALYSAALMVTAAALLALGVPAYATKTDDQIKSSAKKSYVFKTYLKDDDIKIQSKDGVVSLTGTVSGEHHKSLAQETVAGLPGVKSVDNNLAIKGERPAEKATEVKNRADEKATEVNAKVAGWDSCKGCHTDSGKPALSKADLLKKFKTEKELIAAAKASKDPMMNKFKKDDLLKAAAKDLGLK